MTSLTGTFATNTRGGERNALRAGLVVSALVHIGALGFFVWIALQHDLARPPVYRVELIAAPSGTRQAGVVSSAPSENVKAADAPSGAEVKPAEKSLTNKRSKAAPAKATPTPARSKSAGSKAVAPTTAKAAPKAGAGKDNGKGADVRNVDLKGIAFPFPGYINNIVRQITLAYSPRPSSAALVAELKFLIRRDGSVSGIEIVKSSGNRLFDLEASGTIESVGSARGFGGLPSGWPDDVLVVYFTFDYALRPS